MTPTEQDKELREAIKHLLGYCMPNQHQCTYEDSRNETQELDEIMQLITADRKRVALEARIDTATDILYGFSRTYKQEVTDSDGKVYLNDSHDYISRYEVEDHIDRLKAQQEEK